MKKYISICACVLLIICSFVSAVFADGTSGNTLSDQITLTKEGGEGSCTIAYSIGVDQESDWNLNLTEDDFDNVSSVCQVYDADIETGSTITAQLSCAEDTRVGIAFSLYDSDMNVFEEMREDNGLGGGGTSDLSYTVPEDVACVQAYMSVLPTQNTFASFDGFSILVNMYVGRDSAPMGTTEVEGTTDDSYSEDVDADVEDVEIEPEDEKSGINPVVAVGGGAAVLAIIALILKGKAGKTAAGAAVKVAKTAAEGAAAAAEAAEETRVVTDPATGAQTLYTKDASGQWVSSDGGSVLDADNLSDWQQQRASDRAWQDKSNEVLNKPTSFEDIDRQEALEEEKIHRESYIEQVAVKHGADSNNIDDIYEKVAHDQARAELAAEGYMEVSEHIDKVIEVTENIKTTADYSVSALGSVTGAAGTVVKDIYAAGTTIGGDVAEAVAAGKDAWDVAQTASGAIAKSAVSVIQNHAEGVVGKAAADILGSAATGGTDALVKGENIAQGIAKGTASGTLNAMVDAGGEMAGALKDGSSLGSLGKDLASSASDVTGDFVKNAGSEAIEDSFNKSFEELNKKK